MEEVIDNGGCTKIGRKERIEKESGKWLMTMTKFLGLLGREERERGRKKIGGGCDGLV